MDAALEEARPDSIDGALVRRRVMAELFAREVEAPRLGRFELRERIGQGGMGVVYRAWDPQLERTIAIKLVDTSGVSSPLRDRAVREARSLAKLAHPNVVTVFEAGLAGDRVWIAMELVEGTTLRQWLRQSPPPSAEAILRQWIAVGRGLQAAHEVGLIHRDIKPSNVLIGDDGRARLIDFGLVRERVSTSADEVDTTTLYVAPPQGADSSNTAGFIGTVRYAAPEQRRGGPVDAAADQYALCVSLWESLCGVMPPDRGEGTPLPPRLRDALLRGLEEDPRRRFASLAELLEQLEAAVAPRRRRLAPAIVLGGLGLVGATLVLSRGSAPEAPPPCAPEAEALDGTWDDSRRAALRGRLGGDGLAFADSTLATVEQSLDDWAARWHQAQQAACVAARVDGRESEHALDLRRACLERRRRSLQVTLDTLLDPGRALPLAAHGPELLAGLPSLTACGDAQRLAEIDPLPEPESERAPILAAYDRLDQARALATTGEMERADAMVDELLRASAEGLAYAPLRMEVEAADAELDIDRGRVSAAVPRLVAVAREAETRQLDELAARLWVRAAVAAAGRWSSADLEGFVVAEAATAVRRLARPREPLLAPLRHAEASLASERGQLDEALKGFVEAQALAREHGDEERAESEQGYIAAVLGEQGRFDEARARLEAGRASAEARWGPRSPRVGAFEFDRAVLALQTGDFEGAEAGLAVAEAIYREAFGSGSYRVARVLYARTKLQMTRGELEPALASIDQALEAYARELGEDHEYLAEIHEARGVLLFFTGDLEGSVQAYEAALSIARRAFGARHPTVGRLQSNQGESLAALGRAEEAHRRFDAALAIYAETLPADHPDLALPLKGRGQIALAQGRAAQAAADLERALALQLRADNEPLELADLRFSLARALAARDGERAEPTVALARRAREGFAQAGLHERAAEVEQWLR